MMTIITGKEIRRSASHCCGLYVMPGCCQCANIYAVSQLADYFSPIQLGVGIPGGCEAAVHATRRYIDAMPDGFVVAKIDFTNAFNSLHRDRMLHSVAERVPRIYRFYHLCYSLKYETRIILSREGPHQGDPLGAVLFCLSIHPDLERLKSELVAGFMDDLTPRWPSTVSCCRHGPHQIQRRIYGLTDQSISMWNNQPQCCYADNTVQQFRLSRTRRGRASASTSISWHEGGRRSLDTSCSRFHWLLTGWRQTFCVLTVWRLTLFCWVFSLS